MKHIITIILVSFVLLTTTRAFALDETAPRLLSGLYVGVGYRHEPQQQSDADARYGLELSSWLFSTAMGSAVGIEAAGEFGVQLADALRLPIKTSLGLAISPIELSDWIVVLHANIVWQGYDGVYWDTNTRLSRDLGVRMITGEDPAVMLAYFWRQPFGWLEQEDRMTRHEHHIQVKVAWENDGDEGILLHATIGRTSFDNQPVTQDYRGELSYIWSF